MKLLRVALVFALLFPACGLAASVYVYQGNPFQMCLGPACTDGAAITASIEVTAPLDIDTAYVSPTGSFSGTVLALLHWSLADGTSSISDSTPDVVFVNDEYEFITDHSGHIVYWSLAAGAPFAAPGLMLATQNLSDQTPTDMVVDSAGIPTYHWAFNQESPGVWTLSQVPEPGTLALVLCGVLAVSLVRRLPHP